jgi:hypothetical protein
MTKRPYKSSAWGQLAYELGQFDKLMKGASRKRRLAILRTFAEKVIDNAKIKPHAMRAWYRRMVYERNGETGPCRVCRTPTLMQHHVIQIQNGGMNWRRNRVWICASCHAEIHPWLKEAEEARQPAPPDTPF